MQSAKPDTSSALVDVGLRAVIALVIIIPIMTIPFSNLVHPSAWQRSLGFWHSFFSFAATGFNISVGILLFSFLRGNVPVLRALVLTSGSVVTTSLALITGLTAYARYKAPVADAAGVYIQVVSPLLEVGMTWHKLSSLSLLGLSVSSFYCLWVYGKHLLKEVYIYVQLRMCLCVCFGLILFFSVSSLIVGLTLAKIHSL